VHVKGAFGGLTPKPSVGHDEGNSPRRAGGGKEEEGKERLGTAQERTCERKRLTCAAPSTDRSQKSEHMGGKIDQMNTVGRPTDATRQKKKKKKVSM